MMTGCLTPVINASGVQTLTDNPTIEMDSSAAFVEDIVRKVIRTVTAVVRIE